MHLNPNDKWTLETALKFMLDLNEHERELARTHSERNAYQKVMRIELERLHDAVRFSSPENADTLPF